LLLTSLNPSPCSSPWNASAPVSLALPFPGNQADNSPTTNPLNTPTAATSLVFHPRKKSHPTVRRSTLDRRWYVRRSSLFDDAAGSMSYVSRNRARQKEPRSASMASLVALHMRRYVAMSRSVGRWCTIALLSWMGQCQCQCRGWEGEGRHLDRELVESCSVRLAGLAEWIMRHCCSSLGIRRSGGIRRPPREEKW
jgi:hypothetical protein